MDVLHPRCCGLDVRKNVSSGMRYAPNDRGAQRRKRKETGCKKD
jgi:hypothetical protein